jgi:hypothetical protein
MGVRTGPADINPRTRYTAEQTLNHSWVRGAFKANNYLHSPKTMRSIIREVSSCGSRAGGGAAPGPSTPRSNGGHTTPLLGPSPSQYGAAPVAIGAQRGAGKGTGGKGRGGERERERDRYGASPKANGGLRGPALGSSVGTGMDRFEAGLPTYDAYSPGAKGKVRPTRHDSR